jgi:release factor glutamine methyltransferase
LSAETSERWTVRRLLAWMTEDFTRLGLDSPRLDAELLLAHALGTDRLHLYLDIERPLSPSERDRARELVGRRRGFEPVAYILGEREFYGRPFAVGPEVLVPRPETELLVALALASKPAGPLLDLCTGSGAIAVTLARELPDVDVDATDISSRAIEVASANAERHDVTARLRFFQGDLFAPLDPARYGCVTVNAPYIAEHEWDDLAPDIRKHEPREALIAGPSGLEVIERVCAQAPDWLVSGGALFLEVGAGQAPAVAARLREDERYGPIETHRDLAGIERVVSAARAARTDAGGE